MEPSAGADGEYVHSHRHPREPCPLQWSRRPEPTVRHHEEELESYPFKLQWSRRPEPTVRWLISKRFSAYSMLQWSRRPEPTVSPPIAQVLLGPRDASMEPSAGADGERKISHSDPH